VIHSGAAIVHARKPLLPLIWSPIRLAVTALIAVAAQVVLNLPVWDWDDRAPAAATAAGVAIAVLAGFAGGVIPGLIAAGAGWALNFVFVADESLEAVIALPAWLAAGGAAGWVATRLLETSQEHRLAESHLAAVWDAASDAILRIDPEGLITAWSPGAEAVYAYRSDEILGRPLADLVAGPDATRRTDRLMESVRTGEPVTDELIDQRRSDGSVFSASVTVIPSTSDAGEPLDAVFVARDVGAMRRMTDQLRNAVARYSSLTEHLPVVTYVRPLAGNGETAFVSPQIDRLVGYTADEWLADPGLFLRLVHPDDRDRVAASRNEVDAAKGLRTSYRMTARGGRIVSVRDEAVVVLDEAGRPLCIQGYLLDISDREAAAKERNELRAAETATAGESRDRQRKLDFVAEAASVLASSLDVRSTVGQVAALAVRDLAVWCVVDVLEEDKTLTRFAAERAEPAALSAEPEATPEPGILDVVRERREELSETQMRLPLASQGRSAVGALTLVTGEHAPPYVADDLSWARAVAGMIALAIDKARLHAEVEARSDANKVLTHVGEGVFLLDRGGLIRLWNPTAAAITGVSIEAAVGKPSSEAIPGWLEVSERVPVGTTREPVQATTLPLDSDRGERWVSISGVRFFGGTVYAFRDITEEHRLDELKAEFIATASHELRTPLAAVYGAAQTLRRHDFALDDAGRERFISLIVDESDRLARIVNQILLANQLEVGRLDLVTEAFDAADLLERVVDSARTHAPSHIEFDVQVAEGVPPVAADKDRARQVLVNLVENAVKYSPGGGRIELGLEAEDGTVQFRVVDEGLGIPADEQSHIFEKFYRLDPNMSQGIGGTGLGLYICSELVERMGGQIWLESEEGKGSSFFFQLPSSSAHPTLPKALEERASSTPPAEIDVGS
jgi:two-component system, OmpR family, phosphate regulon sensor histidine kinase PhoR